MNFRHSPAVPYPMLTLGHLSEGRTAHSVNVGAARDALLGIPVNYIQGVQNFLEGTSTLDQNTKLFEQLSTYAKTCGVGIGFHSQSKQVEAAVTDNGVLWLFGDGGNETMMTQLYSPENVQARAVEGQASAEEHARAVEGQARVRALFKNISAMIEAADTDITAKGLVLEEEQDSASAPKKKAGRVYASSETFGVRYKLPGSGNQSTTTRYSYAVAKMPRELAGGYILSAKIN